MPKFVVSAALKLFSDAFGRAERRDASSPTEVLSAEAEVLHVPSRGATANAPSRSRAVAHPRAKCVGRATAAVSRVPPVHSWTLFRVPRDSSPTRASLRTSLPESTLASERAASSVPRAPLLKQHLLVITIKSIINYQITEANILYRVHEYIF